MQIKKPEMIIFDYGNTLMCEPELKAVKGMQAIMPFALSNREGVSAEEAAFAMMTMFARLSKTAGKDDLEIHAHCIIRAVTENLGLEFSIPLEQIEQIFWENASPGLLMPGIASLLDYINQKDIRSAVISNIAFSGATLKERIDRNLPNHRFEFIMASSEYVYKKPHEFIFETALKKANLPPEKVFYCGDSLRADVSGSHALGIFPVLYDNALAGQPKNKEQLDLGFDFLHIHEWEELICLLDTL